MDDNILKFKKRKIKPRGQLGTTGDVIDLGPSSHMSVEQALAQAGKLGLKKCVVIGLDEDDNLAWTASRMDNAMFVYLLEQAKLDALGTF